MWLERVEPRHQTHLPPLCGTGRQFSLRDNVRLFRHSVSRSQRIRGDSVLLPNELPNSSDEHLSPLRFRIISRHGEHTLQCRLYPGRFEFQFLSVSIWVLQFLTAAWRTGHGSWLFRAILSLPDIGVRSQPSPTPTLAVV
jgi:hypothetical protein